VSTSLYGGSLDDFAGSMAADIEDALRDVRAEEGLDAPGDDDNRRILFVAIARGVISHLHANQAAFRIHVEAPLPRDTTPQIQVRQ
jgi:hypothetical protein